MQSGRALALFALIVALVPLDARAQTPGATGTIEVAITTQSTIALPGVLVELFDQNGRAVDRQVSDGQGKVQFTSVPRGPYQLVASLEGFQKTGITTAVTAGESRTITIDMPIVIGERVEVVAPPVAAETIGSADAISSNTVEIYGGVD